jgi:hypothetical protein
MMVFPSPYSAVLDVTKKRFQRSCRLKVTCNTGRLTACVDFKALAGACAFVMIVTANRIPNQ